MNPKTHFAATVIFLVVLHFRLFFSNDFQLGNQNEVYNENNDQP